MRPLLLLRPEPGLSASAARARALGLEVVECPLFRIEPVPWTAPGVEAFDALLLTSANAAAQAGAALGDYAGLPVHAVGATTAQAARDQGLHVSTVGTDGLEALLRGLPGKLRLLHLAGEHRVATDPGCHAIAEVVTYRAAAISDPALPPIEGKVIAVHSPRAGSRLAEITGGSPSAAIAAISAAAAAACGGGWERVETAEAPADEALLALAARLCQG